MNPYPARLDAGAGQLKVSVVIPTYNRVDRLRRVLEGLGSQTFPMENMEVLIVSDGSTDGTEAFLGAVKTPFELQAFFQPNQGAAAARNYGISQARGEIVLFIDDDVIPTPQLIQEHLRYHVLYGSCAVVIGTMLTPPDFRMSPWVRWEQEMLAKQYHDMNAGKWKPTARQFYTGNTSLPRRFLIESGGFDPNFRRAEDVELAYRLADAGLEFYFNPQAIGYHYAERSFSSWLEIPYAYGCNDVIFASQKKQTWLLPTIFEEFFEHHPLIRSLIRLCLDRPMISPRVSEGLEWAMQAGTWLKWPTLSRMACSGIFNLHYYQGVADELGGRKVFFNQLKSGAW